MGALRLVALGAVVLLPFASAAQEPGEDAGRVSGDQAPAQEDAGGPVSGAPLNLSHLGRVHEGEVPAGPAFQADPWGIREHRLYVVPAGSKAAAPAVDAGDLPRLPRPAWPSEHQLHDWDFAKAYSFPELTRSVDASAFSYFGGNGHDEPVFAERVRANFYLLEAGVTFFNSVGGHRDSRTDMDLDLRIPFTLGKNHHQLAVLPGVTFPIDGRDWTSRNSNIRIQAIYGFTSHGVGGQLRAGFTDGERRAGLLKVRERVDTPATLVGALLAWRFLPAVQVRAEANAEIATDSGPDRLTLLPGFAFFPLGDPRVTIGLTAIVEDSSDDLDFDHASYGGLVQVGAGFL